MSLAFECIIYSTSHVYTFGAKIKRVVMTCTPTRVCLYVCVCARTCVCVCTYHVLYLYFQEYSHFTFVSLRWTNRRRGRRRLVVPSVVFSTIAVLSMLYKVLAAGGDLMQTHNLITWNGRLFAIKINWMPEFCNMRPMSPVQEAAWRDKGFLSHSIGFLVDSIGIKLWYIIS
jgi:hypothetical protein